MATTRSSRSSRVADNLEEIAEAVETAVRSATGRRPTLAEVITGDEVEFHDSPKMILPRDMTYDRASKTLKRLHDESETIAQFSRQYRYRPNDVGYAAWVCMKNRWGMASGATMETFFGMRPAESRTIEIGVGKTMQIPWGLIEIPSMPNLEFFVTDTTDEDFGSVGLLFAKGPKKYKAEVEALFDAVEEFLATSSIYRGHALIGSSKLEFLDTSLDLSSIVFADDVLELLEGTVWGAIRYSAAMRREGVPLKRAVLLHGPYGCMSGDTELVINRGGNGRRYPISEVVEKFNGGGKRTWDPTIPTMVQYRSEDGALRSTPITGAWCSGRKQTFTVVTSDGRSVRATDEHPFLTEDGWKRLDEITVGSRVWMREDNRRHSNARERGERKQYRSRSVGALHPYGKGDQSAGYHVGEHRLVVEANDNGMTLDAYIERLHENVEGLKFLDPTVTHVHHINKDPLDNRLENLAKMTHREHAALHARESARNVLFKSELVDVVAITPYGEEMTYDIEVEASEHNFVANGFIVHNTGKSSAGLLTAQIAAENGWTFLSAKPGRDKVEDVLRTARLYEPAVVFVEDIDAQANNGEVNSVSRLLDAFDGITSKGGELMIVLTTNHLDRIHRGMLRPGRLDAIVEIAGLDRGGIERLIKAVVPKGKLADDVDYDAVYTAMDGFLPAFVRETITRAVSFAVTRTKGQGGYVIDTPDLVHAAKSLLPQQAALNGAGEGAQPTTIESALGGVVSKALGGLRTYDGHNEQYYGVRVSN